ncbi:cbb3-type cytochrome c oxidase subunit 3 [Neotabrizicola sp. VNH66]|uniref:cbb3-type cytochrome c oxidase subunit 3 n=1 Tax=Neotabrizicola sp. VNH66 TaxID=3400918 RepID=UPI003C07213B
MEIYTFLRHMADSWGLLALFLVFAGVVVWAFRPGSRQTHDEIANSIFRNERTPAAEAPKPDLTEA